MKYKNYKTRLQTIADIGYSAAVLNWDQETYMPEKGASFRARQLATLSGMAHDLFTEKELGKILKKLNASHKGLNEKQKRNVTRSLKDYRREKKYTREFVELLSRTTSECFHSWQKARKENDFKQYAPHLGKMIDLKRREADMVGYKKHPYDALLDVYEPGARVEELDVLFKEVRAQLVPFIKQVISCPKPDDNFMHLHYPKDKQWELGMELLRQMNYDFKAGRQDISAHPFTTSFNPLDVRLTTRIAENDLSMIWSCIHEGGHGLYEQGLPQSEYGLPSGEAVSLGIHESQSRLWENMVGRSMAYWKCNFKKLQEYFPENLGKVSVEHFYKAVNIVAPSFIRTEADELTYHTHILIRYEIEKAMMEGKLKVTELPECWNSKYKEYLGIKVPSDAKGVLQDIHWSHGSIGYFPTYSLGSFYSAQFFAAAKKEIKDLENKIENGKLLPLLEWLRDNIHRHGKYYGAEDLCKKVTGEKLELKHYMNYVKDKFSTIYQLKGKITN